MSRFVTPATVRVALSGGEWIEIKDRLTIGEQKRMEAAGLKSVSARAGAQAVDVSFEEFSFARTQTYLVNWSLKDAADNQTKVSRAAIEALDQDTYEEIESAITAHIEARDAAKKTRTGANESAGS